MERITEADLKNKLEQINTLLMINKSKNRLEIGHRYNYIAIDIKNAETGGIRSTLRAGMTKSEAYVYLDAYVSIKELEG